MGAGALVVGGPPGEERCMGHARKAGARRQAGRSRLEGLGEDGRKDHRSKTFCEV